jgi:tetratricopeptide (TPR) repeat protein
MEHHAEGFYHMGQLGELKRALEEALHARPPDYATAAAIIERIVLDPSAGQTFYLPELLDKLADYYASMGRFDEAIAAMNRALVVGYSSCPDGRHRIAEFLLRAGRADEAHALYEMLRHDAPEDIWLYNAAGLEYGFAGDHERALTWLSKGLELCLDTGDPKCLVEQLLELREKSLVALGHDPDALQERAKQFIMEREKGLRVSEPDSDPHVTRKQDGKRGRPSNAPIAVGWFPASEFQPAVDRWPFLLESWGAYNHEEYCRSLQHHLLTLYSHGLRPGIAPIRVDEYIRWSESEGLDPATSETRVQYIAMLTSCDQFFPWPPERNHPCWCGSGRKYKRCCGTVVLESPLPPGISRKHGRHGGLPPY